MKEYKVKVYKNITEWFYNGFLHREDGPAVEYSDGEKEWYINGKRHREDGPAREWSNGDKMWYKNGKRHREDGPAVDTDGFKAWYLNDIRYTEAEFLAKTQPAKELTIAQIEEILGYSIKIVK